MWRKLIGAAFMVFGIALTARGAWQWNDPPLDPGRQYVYVSSRQIRDVSFGPMCVLLGICIYRLGWKAFER
jgi:hypothetical protein